MKRLGQEASDGIDWSNPRLVCIARDFNKYDEHAVAQMNRSIELVRYRDYQSELLALELLTAVSGTPIVETGPGDPPLAKRGTATKDKTVSQYLDQSSEQLRNLYADLDAALTAFGDDVQKTTRKLYFAYKRLKNFACVEVHPSNATLLVYIKVDPDSIELIEGFTRDVRTIGHFGTGDLEIKIRTSADLERAGDLLQHSYNAS